MKRNQIPDKVKLKCIEMSNSGKTSREIYVEYFSRYYDTEYVGFRSMLLKWRKKSFSDKEILEVGNLDYKFTPHDTTVQIDKNGKIIQSWIKSKADDHLYIELLENIKNLQPVEEIKTDRQKVEQYMLEIPLFDMHFGICDLKYYTYTMLDVIDIISMRAYEEINIIIGQDLFHNDNFRGQTANGTDIEKVDICKAWNDARQFYYTIINKSLQHSKRTNVVFSKGNHDESMSWAFVQMIKAEYGKQVNVDDCTKARKIITFGTNFIGITHGDTVRTKCNKLPAVFTVEYPVEFSQSKVREIHAGHLHHESQKDDYGIILRQLSSSSKTDEWHYNNGFVGGHKRFTLFEWTPDKLKSIHYV